MSDVMDDGEIICHYATLSYTTMALAAMNKEKSAWSTLIGRGFALIGPQLHRAAVPAFLCHKEPALGTTYQGYFACLYGIRIGYFHAQKGPISGGFNAQKWSII